MGLHVDIYRDSTGDCTNGGISAKARALTLMNVEGPFDPSPDAPPALLVAGNLRGTVKIIPAGEPITGVVGPMMGGNYAATCDGRFSAAVEKILGVRFYGAVAIHDRYETVKEYAANCD